MAEDNTKQFAVVLHISCRAGLVVDRRVFYGASMTGVLADAEARVKRDYGTHEIVRAEITLLED